MKSIGYFYHVTSRDHGKKAVLPPRPNGPNRMDEEGDSPRICVSPTPEQCFIALGQCATGINSGEGMYIYRTKDEVEAIPAPFHPCANALDDAFVEDAAITGEHWLSVPTKFVLVGMVTAKSICEGKAERVFFGDAGILSGNFGTYQYVQRQQELVNRLLDCEHSYIEDWIEEHREEPK